MPVLRKRKGRMMSLTNKRKKVLNENSSESNPELKVENEFDTLFEEEEVDLTTKEDLQDIKLDLFNDLNNFGNDSSSKSDNTSNGNHKVSTSLNNGKNRSSNFRNSTKIAKIINDQKEAFKLIQAALGKFENVTKELEEMLEIDIEEEQADGLKNDPGSSIDSFQITEIEGESSHYWENSSEKSTADSQTQEDEINEKTKECCSKEVPSNVSDKLINHSDKSLESSSSQISETQEKHKNPVTEKSQKTKNCVSKTNSSSKLPYVLLRKIDDVNTTRSPTPEIGIEHGAKTNFSQNARERVRPTPLNEEECTVNKEIVQNLQIARQSESDSQMDNESDSQMDSEPDSRMDSESDSQMDSESDSQMDSESDSRMGTSDSAILTFILTSILEEIEKERVRSTPLNKEDCTINKEIDQNLQIARQSESDIQSRANKIAILEERKTPSPVNDATSDSASIFQMDLTCENPQEIDTTSSSQSVDLSEEIDSPGNTGRRESYIFHLNDSCDIISNIDKEFVEKGNVFEEEIVLHAERNTSSTSNDADRDIPVTSQVDFAIENHQERKMTRSRSVDRNKDPNESGLIVAANRSPKKSIPKNNFRPCLFCGIQQSKLKSHIKSKHKSEPEVANALKLPEEKQRLFFDLLRKRGISKANEESLKLTGKVKFMERKSKGGPYVKCSNCSGFYKKKNVGQHLRRCKDLSSNTSAPHYIPVCGKDCEDTEFNCIVKGKFRDDEIGLFIKGDVMLQEYGMYLYQKAKKKVERKPLLRKNLMNAVRRIGKIFIHFKRVMKTYQMNDVTTSLDLFRKEYFDFVMEAIDNMTNSKLTGKQHIGYRLMAYGKFLKMLFSSDGNEDCYNNVNIFLTQLQVNWEFHFGFAQNETSSLIKLEKLPTEDEIRRVRDFLEKKLEDLDSKKINEWTATEFVLARRVVVCKLTFFNDCKGNEVSRLTLKNWEDAVIDKWIDKNSKKMRNLFKTLKLAYVTGNGNKMIPIFIPESCTRSIERLQDKQLRKRVGVPSENIFCFPQTQNSDTLADVWTDINVICLEAGVATDINATKMTHHLITAFARMEMPEREREALLHFA
ncbi:UNVERIFIED_CONTAM: hypothetical protein RMT77_007765 [Armadillidium vulgare]